MFLPFLPMLPTQILLNNVLYDLSEVAIPLDHVDAERGPRPAVAGTWDSSATSCGASDRSARCSISSRSMCLLVVLHADEALFQTGWFVESLATQVLVIFVIRTRRNPLSEPTASGAGRDLAWRSCSPR